MQIEQSDYLEARHEALAHCLRRLPASQRDMLNLRYAQNLSIQELAARQQRQPGAVYTTLSRIRKALEHCIRSALRQEGYCS